MLDTWYTCTAHTQGGQPLNLATQSAAACSLTLASLSLRQVHVWSSNCRSTLRGTVQQQVKVNTRQPDGGPVPGQRLQSHARLPRGLEPTLVCGRCAHLILWESNAFGDELSHSVQWPAVPQKFDVCPGIPVHTVSMCENTDHPHSLMRQALMEMLQHLQSSPSGAQPAAGARCIVRPAFAECPRTSCL